MKYRGIIIRTVYNHWFSSAVLIIGDKYKEEWEIKTIQKRRIYTRYW